MPGRGSQAAARQGPERSALRAGWLVSMAAVVRLLRPHQWSKNLLVFVPILTIHDFTVEALTAATLAFFAFCLMASAGYVVNDLVDLEGDRQHPTRRFRPLASGEVSTAFAWCLLPVLIGGGVALALQLPREFQGMLAVYFIGTLSYSLYFKRRMAVDVVLLGALYTVRVLAGDEAMGSDSSEWLMAFAMFWFLALALVKRHTELSATVENGGDRVINRSYRTEDLRIMLPMAAASGFSALAIFARYIGHEDVRRFFSDPEILWYIAPVMLYWLMRMIFLANRDNLHEDPVVFAMTDFKSLLCAAVVVAALFIAW